MDIKNLELKYFLIILIILLLIYLIYINFIENKSLESFKSRNSLVTYYHSDDDYNFGKNDTLSHELNQNRNDVTYIESPWNGSYNFVNTEGNEMYVTFLQVNKTLLFVINRANYQITNPKTDYIMNEESEQKQCLPGMLIAKGELNLDETLFYLKNVYCTNNNEGTGPFNPMGGDVAIENGDLSLNLLSGYINENGNITLTQYNENGEEIASYDLTKQKSYKFGPSAQYLLRTSYNVPAPNVQNDIKIIPDVCINSSFGNNNENKGKLRSCYITDQGLPTPDDENTQDGYTYNSYGTGCAIESEIIDQENSDGDSFKACPISNQQTCYIPIKNSTGTETLSMTEYPQCNTTFNLSVNNQSSLMYPFYMKNNNTQNSLEICNHLEGFQSGKYNSAILMYVNNLADVQSLNYDFFGIKQNENYLTTKLDIMFPYMNENVLKYYRQNIDQEDSIQLTNCIQRYNSTDNYNSIISGCSANYNKIEQQYQQMKSKLLNDTSKSKADSLKELYDVIEKIDSAASQNKANNLLQPTVWNLGFFENDNTGTNEPLYTNDCSFTISTSDKYTKESRFVKYAEFDSAINKTNLNLYKGGNKQKLVLENSYVLNSYEKIYGSNSEPDTDSNGISNSFILLTGNLKTYHPKKYLIPGQNNKFNSFGRPIYLNNEVNPNGKWVILGFNLTNNLDNFNSTNSYNTTLIKTLKRISDAINDSSS